MGHSVKKPHEYEFLGPPGAFLISFGLPVFLYFFTFACNDVSGCPTPSLLRPSTLTLEQLKKEVGWPEEGLLGLGSWYATKWVLAYYLFSLLLYRFLPATEVEGTKLANGGKLKYRLNAFASSTFTLAVCAAGTIAQGADFPVWTFIADNYLQILTANILLSFLLATFVYARSFTIQQPKDPHLRLLAAGGQSGNYLYDWFIGRELNPRVSLPVIGEVDIKAWLEVRPGLLGWILLDCAFVAKQFRTFGFVTDGIAFITLVQALYVLDSHFMEPAILTTMDLTTDGFGMMLAFGDIVWVPFFYSTQTRYLATHPVSLGPVRLGAVALLLATGYYIFRASNAQKNAFRRDPNAPGVRHLKSMQTKRGTRLLVSGWWGVARHINYLGDWLQAWPYSLPTGVAGYVILGSGQSGMAATGEEVFETKDGRLVVATAHGWGMLFTYMYVLYFAILLIHRDRRDDEHCRTKYGEDWERYKSVVRWRIVPGVY